MSMTMDENIKRWTAKRKTALLAEAQAGLMGDNLSEQMASYHSARFIP